MATALTKEIAARRDEAARFAEENIAGRDDLDAAPEFPWDIWRAMSRAGLAGLSLPREYGGQGGGYLALATAGEALVRHGHNLGLALSWAVQNIAAQYLILGFGHDGQRREYLPQMADGRLIACLAVSEPKAGAHPKLLKTSAVRQGDSFCLSGEKTYLTNGPIADLFIVIAVTEIQAGQKRFTAFLTPKTSPGLSAEPMPLDFLRPSPHGGIKLDNVLVPAKNILGQEGLAYETIIKPFREIEDTVMMGVLVGGLSRQLELLAGLIREHGLSLTDGQHADFGELQFLIHTLRIMAYEAALMLDSGDRHPEHLSLTLGHRRLVGLFQAKFQDILSGLKIEADPRLAALTKDLAFTADIAKNVARIKQGRLGRAALAG